MNFGGTIRINRVGFCIICAVIILFVIYLTPKHLSLRSDKINLRRLLLASIEAAERGGLEVIKVSKESNINEEIKGKTKEGVKIPVTEADYRSHCVMYYGITKLFPSISVSSDTVFSNVFKCICNIFNALYILVFLIGNLRRKRRRKRLQKSCTS